MIAIKFDGSYELIFDLNKSHSSIYKSDQIQIKEYKAPFDILLKKRLNSAKILSIKTLPNNRILAIKATLSGSYKEITTTIYLEFTGRFTNAIICDENGVIVEALHHFDNDTRSIKVGKILTPLDEFEIREKPSEIIENFDKVCDEFLSYHPDIVLMDISLPFYSGYYWCEKIRQISKVPIIFVSSASDNMNIIMAVNMGGDDFIAKPFDFQVLMAKIQAILRRTYDFADNSNLIEHKGLIFNLSDLTVLYNGKKAELTKNEARILQQLLEKKGKIVSRDSLMMRLWETDSFVE